MKDETSVQETQGAIAGRRETYVFFNDCVFPFANSVINMWDIVRHIFVPLLFYPDSFHCGTLGLSRPPCSWVGFGAPLRSRRTSCPSPAGLSQRSWGVPYFHFSDSIYIFLCSSSISFGIFTPIRVFSRHCLEDPSFGIELPSSSVRPWMPLLTSRWPMAPSQNKGEHVEQQCNVQRPHGGFIPFAVHTEGWAS